MRHAEALCHTPCSHLASLEVHLRQTSLEKIFAKVDASSLEYVHAAHASGCGSRPILGPACVCTRDGSINMQAATRRQGCLLTMSLIVFAQTGNWGWTESVWSRTRVTIPQIVLLSMYFFQTIDGTILEQFVNGKSTTLTFTLDSLLHSGVSSPTKLQSTRRVICRCVGSH